MKNWISSLAIILVSIYSAQPIEAQIFTSKKKAKTEKSKNNKTKEPKKNINQKIKTNINKLLNK